MHRAGVSACALALVCLTVAGCERFQSDYVKMDLTPRTTFAPVSTGWKGYYAGEVERDELLPADEMTVARFGADAGPVESLDVQWSPTDFDGNRRWDGFDVTVMPLGAQGRTLRKPGGLIIELHRFNPNILSRLGEKLLVWKISEAQLLPTWESDRYHFRLSWWQNKPRQENFYVVMAVTFIEHDGTVHSRTKAPALLTQSRYETP